MIELVARILLGAFVIYCLVGSVVVGRLDQRRYARWRELSGSTAMALSVSFYAWPLTLWFMKQEGQGEERRNAKRGT